MANVLLAWEMGAGFGHLVVLRAIARELRARGHACAFAARMLGNAREFLDADLGPIWQAPIHLGTARTPVKTQVSYASLLHNTGFDDPFALAGRIEAWRLLLATLKTDLLFADHSPVAIVAARTLGIPVCHVGTGFTVPPLLTPFPSFRPRMSVPAQVLAHNEREVLKELNRALERLKLAPLPDLQEIFRGTLPAVLGYRELDHYEVERPEPYRGLPDYSYGEAPPWPAGSGPKVFAYLRPIAQLDKVLEGLKRAPARVLLRISGVPPDRLRPYLRPGFAVVEKPIGFRLAAESCDAFVNYSAFSTVGEFLLAG
ncbi:MAG: hypothetical protein HYV18_04620, partial [Gammaproteobacteria bacterium]|nr:hypothetical protein [Gammaproteobacteria bacterium]